MSAAWAKGRNQRYAYYSCFQKKCPGRRKSIAKERIEDEFGALVQSLRPSRVLVDMAQAMWRDLWDARASAAQSRTTTLKRGSPRSGAMSRRCLA